MKSFSAGGAAVGAVGAEQWEQWEQLAVGCLARGHLDMEQRLFIYKGPPVKLCDSGLQEEPDLRV